MNMGRAPGLEPASDTGVFLRLHPATPLVLWLLLALALHLIQGLSLVLACAVLIFAGLALDQARFLSLSRRTRWLLLSIAIIHALTTPGEPAWPRWGDWPTAEGLAAGLEQVLRLLALLAAMAVLLGRVPGERSLAGFHALLAPLRMLGMDTGRAAVRLWLTLEYAREPSDRSLAEMLGVLDQEAPPGPERLSLPVHRAGLADALILGFAGALVAILAA